MMLSSLWPALALALGVAASDPAAAAQTPLQAVQALYAEPSLALGGPESTDYLAQDLSAALGAASARSPDRLPLDFDYRYGSRETEITGFMLLPIDDPDQPSIVAVFKNFGEPESVDWTLCRTAQGDWRIADASSNSGRQSWDLRQMLRLPQDAVRC